MLWPTTKSRSTSIVQARRVELANGAGAGMLQAKVEFSGYLGGTRFAYCSTGDGQSIVVEHRGEEDLDHGQIVHLKCPQNRLCLFLRRVKGSSEPVRVDGLSGTNDVTLRSDAV